MQVKVNGKTHEFAAGLTVAELLIELDLANKRLAVECNGQIIPKSQHADTRLGPADQLEIVMAVGGG